eukprot:GGOE01019788.1.p1 GENE.GGOE01019788.1~~GGOE01019788.1.p1  ORF type:complete len:105 (-),score=22.32 GGOE01019788.1:235-549(-)
MQLAERPSLEWARLNLLPPPPPSSCGEPSGDFLTPCGLYVLPPTVFTFLAEQRNNLRNRTVADISLVEAADRVRQEAGLQGVVLQGRCHDFREPGSYRALQAQT